MSASFPSWLEVDLDAVEANVGALRGVVGPSCQVAAVVKAHAYGLGAEEVSRAALRGGATQLAVARVREGVALRCAGITAPILVLSAVVPAELEICVRHVLTPTVVEPDTITVLEHVAEGLGRLVDVHLKVDTGLTRYGAQPDEFLDVARTLVGCRWLRLEGLYTHFAASDEDDLGFTREQVRRFAAARATLAGLGLTPDLCHAANSAGAIRLPEARFDMVRAGITLGGYVPTQVVPADGLRPAASLKAVLMRVYELEPGTTVGYGRTYAAEGRLRAGLVPLGYADGIPRALSGVGEMLVRGRRVPIIGRVSMDQVVVDLTGVPEAAIGDEVVALGAQGGDAITLDELARLSGTIPHEALCRLGARLPRVYRRDGQTVRVMLFNGGEVPE